MGERIIKEMADGRGRKREDDYNLSVSTYVEAEDNGTITKQLVSQSQDADDRGDRGGVCEWVIEHESYSIKKRF